MQFFSINKLIKSRSKCVHLKPPIFKAPSGKSLLELGNQDTTADAARLFCRFKNAETNASKVLNSSRPFNQRDRASNNELSFSLKRRQINATSNCMQVQDHFARTNGNMLVNLFENTTLFSLS